MRQPVANTIQGQKFWLSPDRCIFWEEQKALIIADMHLGKESASHTGILPHTNFERLLKNIFHFKANRIIIIGDFSQSPFNKELSVFKKWRKDFPLFRIDYIRGYQPIAKDSWLLEANLTIHQKQWMLNGFCFRHLLASDDPADEVKGADFIFSGHLRPCIRISGTGNKALRLPCFYITQHQCLLPSFGKFNCQYQVKPLEGELVYVTDGLDIFQKN